MTHFTTLLALALAALSCTSCERNHGDGALQAAGDWPIPARYRAERDALTRDLESERWRDRYAVIERLVADSERTGVAILLRLLEDPYPNVRVEAARALGTLGSRSESRALMASLDDENPGVRAVSAWALGELGCVEAIPAISALDGDAEDDVREKAHGALLRLGVRAIVEDLIRDLSSQNALARRDACRLLGKARCLAAAPELVALLSDAAVVGVSQSAGVTRQRVSDYAHLALLKIADEDIPFEWNASDERRKEVRDRWNVWLERTEAKIRVALDGLR